MMIKHNYLTEGVEKTVGGKLGDSNSPHYFSLGVIAIIRADFIEGAIYTVMERTRAKLFQSPIDMCFIGRAKGCKTVSHFLFQNIPGGWTLAIANHQLMDYKIRRKDKE